jgi:hypothetical protein
MGDAAPDFGDALIDVTALSLRDLSRIDGSLLGAASRQVTSDASQVAAFSSAI